MDTNGVQEVVSKQEAEGPALPAQPDKSSNPPPQAASTGGELPWGFVAVAAGAFFLMSNKAHLAGDGAFIYLIGAIVLGVLSANSLSSRG